MPVSVEERLVNHSYRSSGPDIRVYGYGPAFSPGGGGAAPNDSANRYGYNYLQLEDSRFTWEPEHRNQVW